MNIKNQFSRSCFVIIKDFVKRKQSNLFEKKFLKVFGKVLKINIFKKIYPEKYINLNLGDVCIFDENLIRKTNTNTTNKIIFAGIIRLREI